MEIIYRTLDGKEFKDESAAQHHENSLFGGVKMWNRRGQLVEETNNAVVLYLANEVANTAFFAIANQQGDVNIRGLEPGEDYGFFVWDECCDEYRWVDEELLRVLIEAQKYLDGEQEKCEKTTKKRGEL